VLALTAAKYRNAGWTETELSLIRDNPQMTPRELSEHLGNRTLNACAQARFRLDGRKAALVPEYAVKAPGEYTETLSAYLVDEFDCLEIWMKWNGYAAWRETSRDELGWVNFICTAK
jgi:hypothetical protein